jgi:pyruvate, orthophosphate dikinase
MFLGDRLPVVQRMILADTEEEEIAALAELHEQQREDFTALLEAMDGLPVTVRLLDPPLHEFLPDVPTSRSRRRPRRARRAGERSCSRPSEHWAEANPMLGTRGCPAGILKPSCTRCRSGR